MDERRALTPSNPTDLVEISDEQESKIVAIFGRIPELFPPYHNYYDTYSPNFVGFNLVSFDEVQQEVEFTGESQDQTTRVGAKYKVLTTEDGQRVLAKRTLTEKRRNGDEEFQSGVSEVEFRQGDYRLGYQVVYRHSGAKKIPNSVNFEVSHTTDLDTDGTDLCGGQSFDGISWNLSFAMDDITQIGQYSWFPHVEPRLTKAGRVRISNYGKWMDLPEVVINTKTGREIAHEYFDPYTYLIDRTEEVVTMIRTDNGEVWSFQFPNNLSIAEVASYLEGDQWTEITNRFPVSFNMGPNYKQIQAPEKPIS